jgi:hypothetical protein
MNRVLSFLQREYYNLTQTSKGKELEQVTHAVIRKISSDFGVPIDSCLPFVRYDPKSDCSSYNKRSNKLTLRRPDLEHIIEEGTHFVYRLNKTKPLKMVDRMFDQILSEGLASFVIQYYGLEKRHLNTDDENIRLIKLERINGELDDCFNVSYAPVRRIIAPVRASMETGNIEYATYEKAIYSLFDIKVNGVSSMEIIDSAVHDIGYAFGTALHGAYFINPRKTMKLIYDIFINPVPNSVSSFIEANHVLEKEGVGILDMCDYLEEDIEKAELFSEELFSKFSDMPTH